MIDELAFAFLAGTVATANPCGFALLPAFLARQLEHTTRGRPHAIARALLVGALTTAGFLVVFATVGSAFSLGARSLTRVLPWAALVIGATFFLAGLAVLAGKRIAIPATLPLRPRSGRGLGTPFLFGLGYGTASLSCTLPIFLAVVGTAITAQPTTGVLAFASYAAGMGTILTALSLAVALSHAGLAARIRRLQPHMRLDVNCYREWDGGAYGLRAERSSEELKPGRADVRLNLPVREDRHGTRTVTSRPTPTLPRTEHVRQIEACLLTVGALRPAGACGR